MLSSAEDAEGGCVDYLLKVFVKICKFYTIKVTSKFWSKMTGSETIISCPNCAIPNFKHKADATLRDNQGLCSVHYAAAAGNTEALIHLLDNCKYR